MIDPNPTPESTRQFVLFCLVCLVGLLAFIGWMVLSTFGV